VSASSRSPFSPYALKSCGGMAAAVFVLLALAGSAWAQEESLGDYARKIRTGKKTEVLISAEDGTKLFKFVDEITQFSSQDSGLPKLAPVKRKLVGKAEAEKHFKSQSEDEAQHERRMDETAVVLKKFGMLPEQFDVDSSLRDSTVSGLAGFYDFADKTMYLLNWIAPELQKMVMAHELTHALQDQNFQLARFALRPQPEPDVRQMKMQRDDSGEVSIARRAVVEGQASVVGYDYDLQAMGVSLADSSAVRQRAETYLQGSYDLPVTIHNAPRLLRELMIFPYREGLQFELALLTHGGRQEAFEEAFKRPPLNTHQILQPEAYFKNEKTSRVEIGDLAAVFGNAYEAYDAGSIGELDVQIMAEEFGRENDIYTVARKWDGGAYVAVKRAGLAAGSKVKASDLALVYVSRWKTRQAAERFGQIYLQAMATRLAMGTPNQQRCDEEKCAGPLWEQHASSSEGPVNVELWPGNLLLITQTVEEDRMQALRRILLAPAQAVRTGAARASAEAPELAPRLLAMPEIEALSEQAGREIEMGIRQQLMQ
jgi:hypothetical protein